MCVRICVCVCVRGGGEVMMVLSNLFHEPHFNCMGPGLCIASALAYGM